MVNSDFWLDSMKGRLKIRSDYALAKRWQVEPTRIRQYRTGRLKIPLAIILDIAADTLKCEPLEIIASLEWHKAKEQHRQAINNAYFDAAKKTIGLRMCAVSSESFRRR